MEYCQKESFQIPSCLSTEFHFEFKIKNSDESDKKDNTVVSPVSIAGALHMLAAGAGGDSRSQILQILGVGKPMKCDKGQKQLVKGMIRQ